MKLLHQYLLLTCLIAASYAVVGCAPNAAPPPQTANSGNATHSDHKHDDHHHGDGHDHGKEKSGHSHDGWWCDEHGVPEAECALCDSQVAAAFQKKGDWCKEHERPDSQCFICHPEKLDEYAAKYEAKFGKKPPKPELN